MKYTATGSYKIVSWDETPTGEYGDGQKISRARVENAYSGDMEGSGVVEYIMAYYSETEAEFTGVEYFEGRIGARSGSFMLRHTGMYKAGGVTSAMKVVRGSGRGELEGISGLIPFQGGHETDYPVEFNYDIP